MDLSELLISEVQKRPALWNLKGKAYHNRVIVDRDWRKVAETTGMSVGVAKVRWKNLRDHFRKELLKQPRANAEGSGGEKKASKWIHFDSLLFLKGVLKPRRAKGKLTVVIESSADADHGEAEDRAVDEDNGDVDSNMNLPTESEKLQTAFAPQHLTPECDLTEAQTSRKCKLERSSTEGNSQDAPSAFESQMMLKMETEKLSLLQSMEDDDLNFLKSLLPYMKSLPPIRKLMIRSQFQNLLVQEMINCQNNPNMLQTLSSAGGLSAADIIPSANQE